MGRTRLNQHGFTLVEAMVSMVIFTIGFSGLFFFYSISQQTIIESRGRLGINLMANRIIETISSQAQRPFTDSKNPFITPTLYSADLRVCSYDPTDDRQSWCTDLNDLVGPYNATSGKEVRSVTLTNDGTGLIIDISIIAEGGKISAHFSRKIRQLS